MRRWKAIFAVLTLFFAAAGLLKLLPYYSSMPIMFVFLVCYWRLTYLLTGRFKTRHGWPAPVRLMKCPKKAGRKLPGFPGAQAYQAIT